MMNALTSEASFGLASGALALLTLLEAALKGFAIFGLAALAALTLRRASAATRHIVWLSGLVCALLLPCFAPLLPEWRALPWWMTWKEITRHATVTAPLQYAPVPEVHRAVAMSPPARDLVPATSVPPSLSNVAFSPVAPVPSPAAGSGRVVLLGWAGGVLLVIGRLVFSVGSLWRLTKRARGVDGGPIVAAMRQLQEGLGLHREIRLLLWNADAMPMVWGIIRPNLLLPAGAEAWSSARMRGVLVHELAHLRRQDPLSMLVAQLALAVHWFNPLAWHAVRQLRIEQERACDDQVLQQGIRASEYASDLLVLTTGLRSAPFASAAVSMAQSIRLEGRIAGILDAGRSRRALTRWLPIAAALLATVIALPLAMLRAEEKESAPVRIVRSPGDVSMAATITDVKMTQDAADIQVPTTLGSLAFIAGEEKQGRVIVHEFGSASGPIAFRVNADDRRGKWWDHVRLERMGESESSIPMLPDDWLPNGRVVFLPTPTKRDDGSLVIAEIESASGRTPLAVRMANQMELSKASDRHLPQTCPDSRITVEAWIYALRDNAPGKPVKLPVMAARDLVGTPRGALGYPSFGLKPGKKGSWDRGMESSERIEATATITPAGIRVEGTLTVPLIEGKYQSAKEAFRRNADESARAFPRKQLRAEFAATLGGNDALVIPISSEGLFPETLVSSLTALRKPLKRERWRPPSARSPVQFDGWVLTWPRSEQGWFASLHDYKDGDPAAILRLLERRMDTSTKSLWSENVGFTDDAETKPLLEAFRQRSGVKVERIEPFTVPQHDTPILNADQWTHFSAAGEGGRMMVHTTGNSISPTWYWDAPILPHVSAAPSIGVESGKSFSALLPGPANPTEIRMMILRCVNPDEELAPTAAR